MLRDVREEFSGRQRDGNAERKYSSLRKRAGARINFPVEPPTGTPRISGASKARVLSLNVILVLAHIWR
jgi:hypothetical protein